ncbi:molybdopterin-guanine dinucleotide biosynthesis protein B [Planococcus chinensis]|uniref:Molybdopterin-guanine dinucleotide biosynthesis protein B n=1 Tax=Planococcus chinensis TaxID=272917 RepID=A0ABW4QKJ0_9BACL
MENMKILQVVGYKNSGKTTLMNRLIALAQETGKKVSAIKHHGHGGKPDLPPAGTDSTQFLANGAASSLVYGGGLVQLHLERQEADLEKFIGFSKLIDPDFILIEGFKDAPYPKAVLVRSGEDWDTLKGLSDIRAVFVHQGVELEGVQTLELDKHAASGRFFREWMGSGKDESI